MFKINERVKDTIGLQNNQFNSKINVLTNFNLNIKLIFIVFCLFSICYYSIQNFENDNFDNSENFRITGILALSKIKIN